MIRERLAASAPENALFARDHWVIHWKCATITKGDEQTQSLRKVHSILIAMQKRGMFARDDEMDLAMVKATLGLE